MNGHIIRDYRLQHIDSLDRRNHGTLDTASILSAVLKLGLFALLSVVYNAQSDRESTDCIQTKR